MNRCKFSRNFKRTYGDRAHRNRSESTGPLYRARDGMIFGVCKGLANRAELNVFWVRLLFVVGLLMTGIWPMLIIYLLAAIFMRPEPMIEPQDDEARDFYNSYATDRTWAMRRLRNKLRDLESRTTSLEGRVVDREYSWEQRLRSGQ
ncbi:MAG: PspC domain-containing protein [Verrucomicrobiota bacterium JB022]|nr:PspC domain-containing protein [Verrucomicrobiota bacterium JB022]